MAVGRYFNPTPYEGKLYTPPVEVLAGALEQAQKQYDTNFLITEKLRNKYINARQQDRARANQIQQEFEKEIDATVAKYNGDYGAATSDLYRLTSKMGKMFGPGGEAAAIENNYNIVQESLKQEKERIGKKDNGITSEQYALLQRYYQNQDPTTLAEDGVYTQVSPIALAAYVDEGKAAGDILNKVATRKKKFDRLVGKGPNGDYQYETVEVEWKDPNEAVAALDQELFSNDAYRIYTRQLAELAGVDPNEYQHKVRQEYVERVVPARTGIMADSRTSKFVEDWRARKAVDYQYDMMKEAFKAQKRLELEMMKDGAMTGDERPSVLAIQKGFADDAYPDLPKEMPDGFFGTIGNWLTGGKNDQPIKVDQLIKDAESGKQLPFSVNLPMLRSIRAANPKLGDSDIIELYNRSKKNVHSYGEVLYDPLKTTKAQKEEALRLMPVLSSGRVPIQEVDPDTGEVRELTADERISFYSDLATAHKNKSPLASAIGKSRTSTGKVWFGTVMPDPKGGRKYYVVKEQGADIEVLQQNYLDPLFKNFIQNPALQTSDPIEIVMGNKPKTIMGYKHWINGVPLVYYYETKKDKKGRPYVDTSDESSILTTKDSYGRDIPIGPTELERYLLTQDRVNATLPRATKSNYELETGTFEDN